MDSFKCNKCQKSFDTKMKAMKHEKAVHDETQFNCDNCDKTFVGGKTFANHSRMHMTLTCKHCGLKLPANSKITHEISCIGSSPFACDKCDFKAKQNISLQRHMKTHNNVPKSIPTCEQCLTEFKFKYLLVNHMKIHHNSVPSNKEPQHKCMICTKAYSQKYNLKKHIRLVHSQNKFENNVGFGIFEGSETPDSNQKIVCDKCDYKTSKSNDMKRHKERKHKNGDNGSKTCDQCNYTAKRNFELLRHKKRKHEKSFKDIPNSSFNCEHCNYTTERKTNLTRHKQKMHEKETNDRSKTEAEEVENIGACEYCNYTSNSSCNLKRHIKKCRKKNTSAKTKYRHYQKLKRQLNIDDKIEKQFSEDDVKQLLDDCNGSVRDMKRVFKWLRYRLGRKAFTPNINKIIEEHINSLGEFHDAEIVTYHDKDGKPIKTVLSKVSNLNLFFNEIAKIRNIQKPKIVLGCDGGQQKCIVTAVLMEEDDELEHNEVLDDCKATGQKRVLLLAKVDGVPENRQNVEQLLNSLNLPDLEHNFQVVCDLKLTAIILGVQGCSALYGCPFCTSYKVDIESMHKTNKRGLYVPQPLCTFNSIVENQKNWMNETNGDRKLLKHFKNCEFPPIQMRKDQGEKEVLFVLPPDPLHVNLLGPCNDLCELLEKKYPNEMKEIFYERHNLKKCGEGPGGQFNGPSIKYILQEHILKDLESTLPSTSGALEYTDYLRSIREVHSMCTAKNLDPNYKSIIDKFSNNFHELFLEDQLNMTLKIHVIIHHYPTYFEKTGTTMKYTNGEFTESCHSSLRKSEEMHGLRVKKNLGTPMHQLKSWQSMNIFNSKRAGFVTPVRLRKKVLTPKISSPKTPFSKKFLLKYPEALEQHQVLKQK